MSLSLTCSPHLRQAQRQGHHHARGVRVPQVQRKVPFPKRNSRVAALHVRKPHEPARTDLVRCEAVTTEWNYVVDEQSGIEYKMLANKKRSVEVPLYGTWAYREGVPPVDDPDVECKAEKENAVVMIHGAGLTSYTYRNLISYLAEKGHRCVAPDLPGHGDTSKLATSEFGYTEESYIAALEAFLAASGLDSKPVDIIVQGFILPQYAMLLAVKRPELVRKVVVMNTPLMPGHGLPKALSAFTMPFVGARSSASCDQLAANGNFYGMGYQDASVFQAPYADPDTKEDARLALMTTVTSAPLKPLLEKVSKAYETTDKRTLVLWGDSDKYLNSKIFYDWCIEKGRHVSFKVLQVGHMPQEDYAAETAAKIMEFLDSE